MQIAVIEYARSILGLQDANSTEFDPNTPNPCVIFMPEGSKTHMGGTMRLGSRRTYFQVKDSKSTKLHSGGLLLLIFTKWLNYIFSQIWQPELCRRYEVNPDMVQQFEDAGLSFTGKDETGRRMEIVELPNHPYFIGVQFHPEFKSRPGKPSAVFLGLIASACGQLDSLLKKGGAPTHVLSNGEKLHRNGTTLANGSLDGIYRNGNGVHV
ncbi:hypothetical protein KY289_037293 [Solanum tuberosum]|nr:hypothetical protein KY289_037293 [Solanum tuberosum]